MQRLRVWLAGMFEHAPFAVLAIPALALSISVTRDLTWPYDIDFFREIAQAQVFADGDWSSEAFYLGEKVWYPPLVPAIVAALARITGLPVPMLYARAGAYFNFLAPVLLYALSCRFFGRLAGFLAVFDHLYLRPAWVPGWATGSYSPWFWSGVFGQAVFLATLLAYEIAGARPRRGGAFVVGLLAALCLQAHASAGMLFGTIVGVSALIDARAAGPQWILVVRRHLAMAAWCSVLALPYLLHLLGHYWHGVANPAPAAWVWSDLEHWHGVWRQLTSSLLLAPVGLVFLLRHQRARLGSRLALLWIGASGSLFLIGFIAPQVPAHHWFAFLRLGLSIMIGVGASALIGVLFRHFKLPGAWQTVVGALACACAVFAAWPHYRQHRDFVQGKVLSEQRAQRPSQLSAYAWLRDHTDPTSVVLTNDKLGMGVVGPAGRKVVAVNSLWASPFVNNRKRRLDRYHAIAFLRRGNTRMFCDLVDQYRITHFLRASSGGSRRGGSKAGLLDTVWRSQKLVIDEIRGCPGSTAPAAR